MDFFQRLLVKFVIRVVTFPKTTLCICGVMLVVSIALSLMRLELSTDQDELMTTKLPFFKAYKEFTDKFPENESYAVIIEPLDYTHPPSGPRWTQFADQLAAGLAALKSDVERVEYRVDPASLGDQGLLFAPSWDLVKDFGGPIPNPLALAKVDPSSPEFRGYQMISDETKRGTPAYDKDQLLLINVYPLPIHDSLDAVTAPLEHMRAVVDKIAPAFPEFKHPVITGRPALEADEMATSDHDTRIAEILGLSLVFVVLLIFLRNLWLAIVAELCLGTGIGWTFGWATVSIGRLNLLSLVFVIALIGIGMDYLIQILARYRFEKKRYQRPQAVWARVFRYVSPPISTACLGAAGAFFASALTDFRGAAELGIIAGSGLLLCLTAGYTLLPALLTLFPASVGKVHESKRYRDDEPLPAAGGLRLVPALIWVAIAFAGLFSSFPPTFDPNLLKLQADGLESVREVRKLQTWYAVILSDNLDTLRQARQKILGHTPAEEKDRLDTANQPADPKSTIDHTDSLLEAYDKEAWIAAHNPLSKSGHALDVRTLPDIIRNHLISTPTDEQAKAGAKTSYALYVYPKDDLWDQDKLEAFVKELESKTPANVTLTGIAPQLYYSTEAIHKAFLQATLYALILIFLLVLLDLRKIGQTLLAISVLLLGLPMLLLVMHVWRHFDDPLQIPGAWNFANFFALPILIGAGHEYGVFMVHRYRETLHDPRRVWRTWDVADRALLLCAIVTSCSFGFLIMAKHHGLASLGWVMAVGSACIYLASLLVLRPILHWRLKKKQTYGAQPARGD